MTEPADVPLVPALPRVTVVVVNYRGAEDTARCARSLLDLDWPRDRLELVVVDNASGDGSVDALRPVLRELESEGLTTRLLDLDENTGFAGGCNRGAEAARGELVALCNNDARPDPAWLRAAVEVLDRDAAVSCVASRVLDWEGERIDYDGAALSIDGQGYKLRAGQPVADATAGDRDVLFATGSAMVIRRDVFADVGGFDDRYFMFFEDVDLGWRLWLLGHRVRYVPASVVYHRHHASMSSLPSWWEHHLLERNALFTIYKNYSDDALSRVLAPVLLLALRRGVLRGDVDTAALDLATGDRADTAPTAAAPKDLLASVFALDAFTTELPALERDRAELQARRVRTDQEIVRLFRLPGHANVDHPLFAAAHEAVTEAFDLAEEVYGERRRIVIATADRLGPQMAGPAIRAYELAVALSAEHDVKLVSTLPEIGEISAADFEIGTADRWRLMELEQWCDVFLFQGFLMHEHPFLRESHKVIICDVYDPFHLEQLEQARDLGEERRREVVRSSTEVINDQLCRGDLFLCASPKQRDFWLGQLAAVGRVNPANYDRDESLSSLVDIVPFGVQDEPPVRTGHLVRGVIPGIGTDDKVILWGGGIYNWFDPITLLHAVDRVRHEVPEVRLVFMGLKHPNPHVPQMRMAVETARLAEELGLVGTHVFFNQGWVPYHDRQNFLLDADIGVSCHLDHVETAYSFRTRILDYLWASLPVVATAGDGFGALLEGVGAGIAVPPADVDALEEALRELLVDDERRAQYAKASGELGQQMKWSEVTRPLIEFCRAPQRAPDLVDEGAARYIKSPTEGVVVPRPSGWRQDLKSVVYVFRHAGARDVARRVAHRAKARLGRT